MKSRAVLCSVLLLTATLGTAQVRTRSPRSPVPEYLKAFSEREDKETLSRAVLRNGLTVLIEEQAFRPLAVLLTYVKAAAPHEGNDDGAVARLLRRLSVNEPQKRGSGEIARQVRALGGLFEAKQEGDDVYFYSLVPAESALKALQIHAEALRNPNFLGPNQGPFRPKDVILAVSGEVRREQILEKIPQLFGGLKNSGAVEKQKVNGDSRAATAGAEPARFQYHHLRANIASPYVFLEYRVPGRTHEDYYPLLLLSTILGQGRGSLLHEYLVDNGKSALEVESGTKITSRSGLLWILLKPVTAHVDSAEVQALAQLDILGRQEIGEEQLNRAKALALRDHYSSLQALEGKAYGLARFEAVGKYTDRDRVPEVIQRITAGQVARAARRYFATSNLVLVEYFPEQAEPRTFTAESFLETIRLLVPEAARKRESELGALKAVPPESPFQPARFTPKMFFKGELRKTSILRGPEIYFKEEHDAPLVNVGLFFPGGRINESSANAGITELMLNMLIRDTETRKGPVLWKHLEQMGARVDIINELDGFGIEATVLSPYKEEALRVLVEWTRKPILDDAGLQISRLRQLGRIGEQKTDDFQRALQDANSAVFGPHPYALNRYGSQETLSKMTLEEVQGWARSRLEKVHPVVLIRGDIDGTAFLEELIPELSEPSYEERKAVKKEIEAPEKKDRRVTEGNTLVFPFPGPAKGTLDDVALNVIENMLSGWGGQLFSVLREEEGIAEDVRLFHRAGAAGGAVFVSLSAPQSSHPRAVERLNGQLQQIAGGQFRTDEFLSALVGTITRFHAQQQNGREYLVELSRNIFAGKAADYESDYLATVKGLKKDEIIAVAGEYLRGVQ